ncbi:hypothetical protein [Nesterenkonia pannonica]|uniref:hypothetical protein n=1 Tax=Nesterenkonia pannonica TaxID=1548602 RepID=UPI0021644C5C|nr:hypothetical protein [Nesterenkonia pannonica]
MGLLERHWRIIFGIALIPGIWMIYNGSVRGIEIGEFSYGPDGSDYTSSYTELITRILIPGAISVTIAAVAEVGRRRSLNRPGHTPTDARAPGHPATAAARAAASAEGPA